MVIDFNPVTVTAEIRQNVETTLHTRIGSVPLDRGFGVDFDFLDTPITEARLNAIPSAVEAIKQGDSRASIEQIKLVADEDHRMSFRVSLEEVE